jgi:ATP-dependent helicase HrpB
MPAPRELPIYELEDRIIAAVRGQGRLIVQAPTGSGKSTQVPQMLLNHGLLGEGEVVVLQPRRLAARMLAKRVAEEVGTRLGEVVGYQIRLDSRISKATRIRFVTEGILLRQMSFDPTLRGISAIVFDEFHERHLYGDISLARALQIQQSKRPDLKLVVMSATLDAVQLRNYLAPCEVLTSQGRTFPVQVEYLAKTVDFEHDPVWVVATRECERIAARTQGDILVFMPGAHEISRTVQDVQGSHALRGFVCYPLHGELPPEQQDRAVARYDTRKIIVSTNVAETSLTIDGVTVVVDCRPHGAGHLRAALDRARACAASVAGAARSEAPRPRRGRADPQGGGHRRYRQLSVVGKAGAQGAGAGGDFAGGLGGVACSRAGL